MIETIRYCMDLVQQEKEDLEAIIDNWDRYGYDAFEKLEIGDEHIQICMHQDRLVAIKNLITSNFVKC